MRTLLVAILLAFSQATFSQTYWVRPEGSNSNSGLDSVNAKLTLDAAVALLDGPGDTLWVCDGRYTGTDNQFALTASGSSGNPIVIRGRSYQGAAIVGNGYNNASFIVTLDGQDYVNIENLKLVDGDWIVADGSTNITISGCRLDSADYYDGPYCDMRMDAASYITFRDCYIDARHNRGGAHANSGDLLRCMSGGHHFLFERDTVTGYSHYIAVWNNYGSAGDTLDYVVWKDCVIYGSHGFGSYSPTEWFMVDGCKLYRMGGWGGNGNNQTMDVYSKKSIFRYTLAFNDTVAYVATGPWARRPEMIAIAGDQEFELPEIHRWYNMTVDARPSTWDMPYVWGDVDTGYAKLLLTILDAYGSDGFYYSDIHWKNSVLSRNEDHADFINMTNNTATKANEDITFTNCILYGRPGYYADLSWSVSDSSGSALLTDATADLPRVYRDSIWTSYPGYKDTSAFDFSLDQTSFAVDRGGALTTIQFDTTNKDTVRLVDPYWFSDGWGMTTGDSIKVGSSKYRITSLDYATGVATLSSTITATAGTAVYYYRSDRFSGSSPDVGAYEYLYAQSSGKLDYTISQINALLHRVADSLNAHYQKKDMNIGTTYHDLNDSVVACTVWDVDKDGDLDPELQNGINLAQSHAWGFVVNVEGGRYTMTNGVTIDGRMRWKTLHGNKTRLMWPAGFTGDMFTIAPDGEASSNNHDLNNFLMEGFVCETNEWPYSQDCRGLVINPLTNGDVVHSTFRDMEFMGCHTPLLIQADSVNCGAGEHDWVNSSHFSDLVFISPDTAMVIRSKPAPTHVIRNTFSNIQVQTSEAAGGGLTRYGFFLDGGFGNRLVWCDIWDNQALTAKIPPLVFSGNARDNIWFGGALESVTGGEVVDNGTDNFVFGFQVKAGTTTPMWKTMEVEDTFQGDKLAGTSSFSGIDQRKAVYIVGATASDKYSVTASGGDSAPGPNDLLRCYAKTDSLVVWRQAGGTSGLSFDWIRIK